MRRLRQAFSAPIIIKVMDRLHRAGFQAYVVGGSVRDTLLNRPVIDWDVATDARAETVTRLFQRTVPTGIEHGTVTVLIGKSAVEVTTFRQDGDYRDHRRPAAVQFVGTIESDLGRRDFTINALAWDLEQGRLLDPYGGVNDLKRRCIRTVGKPSARFAEDALRLMRAARFAAQLGFTLEPATLAAMSAQAPLIAHISHERVRDELVKILNSPRPGDGLRLLYRTALLKWILPELYRAHKDIREHRFRTADCLRQQGADTAVLLAGLLHGLGKAARPSDNGTPWSEKLLRRLCFSNHDIKRVSHLIRKQAIDYEKHYSDAELRFLIADIGREAVDDVWQLRLADVAARRPAKRKIRQKLVTLGKRLKQQLRQPAAYSVSEVVVNGEDVKQVCGLRQGRKVGSVLSELLKLVLQQPELNQREILLQVLIERYRQER